MDISANNNLLRQSTEPEFIPRPGQVDYRNLRWCPVVVCLVRYNTEILLLKRSANMRLYPGKWDAVSGYLDDDKGLHAKVLEELQEELGVEAEVVKNIKTLGVYDLDEPEIAKTWIVHAVVADLSHKNITTDWETDEYRWLTLEEAYDFDLVPGFERLLDLVKDL